jgi:phosphoglucosamine mutase
MQDLIKNNWSIGGESSGHIICLDKSTTGDGIIASLQVISWLVEKGISLEDACQGMQKYPQLLVNVPVSAKINPNDFPAINDVVKSAEAELANTGRVLLRASGTEPLIRVMVEGQDNAIVEKLAHEIAEVVKISASKPFSSKK